jgi:DNA invertase Pin-like site-specific DNA recombinase
MGTREGVAATKGTCIDSTATEIDAVLVGRDEAGLTEFERELIRARTGEGRTRAKAGGVKMGQPPKLTAHQVKEAIARRDAGDETLREIARSYSTSHSTISRLET